MIEVNVPLTVPTALAREYTKNYRLATKDTGRLFLFAGDQKVEHLNNDFKGDDISIEDQDPEHLFKIAATSHGGVLATHLGFISRYGHEYRSIPYLVKMNGKTNLGNNELKNSSKTWWSVNDIIKFKKDSGLNIVGVGYTLYLGGQFEAEMLVAASQMVYQAHQAGLTAIIWVYPRGFKVKEDDIKIIAGGAGVAAATDADFIKIKYPYNLKDKPGTAKKFTEAIEAAGRTQVVCVGGSKRPVKLLLEDLEKQIKISGTSGLAMGRNLHQRSLEEASKLTASLGAIIFHNKSASEAYKIYSPKTLLKPKSKSKFLGLF